MFDELGPQANRNCVRLAAAELGQFYIAMALEAPGSVPFGGPMADQREFDRLAYFFQQVVHVVGMLFFNRENLLHQAARRNVFVA